MTTADVWIPRLLPGTPAPDWPADGTFIPGIYDDMPEDAYHADPVPGGSLSASGAKLLLPPSCPALYRYRRDHPKTSAAFDYGTTAHKLILATGPKIDIINAPDWRAKAAQDARKASHAAGNVPMLSADFCEVVAMESAIRAHPLARALFDPEFGKAEQSLFWIDEDTGIWRRARLDYLPERIAGRRLVIGEYKTAAAVDPESIRKAVANFAYHQQSAQYIDGVRALGLDDDPAFLFVFQMKTEPYLVTVAELDDVAIQVGRARNRLACEIYRDCREANVWPGYSSDIELISLPPWVTREHEGAW